jgi:hypothetical protein
MINSSLDKLSFVGRDGFDLDTHPYLFITKTGEEPFLNIMNNLHELNDVIVTLRDALNVVRNKTKSYEEEVLELKNKTPDEDYNDEWFDLDFKLHHSYNQNMIGLLYTPASAFVLLYVVLVQGLQEIILYYKGKEFLKDFKKNTRESEVKNLLSFLYVDSNGKIDLTKNKKMDLILNKIRQLRNEFVHGDWFNLKNTMLGLDIISCFKIVAELLESVESYYDGKRPDNEKLVIW